MLQVIETSLDWELREEHYKLNIAALQKNNDALSTTLTTTLEARLQICSALKKQKVRTRKGEAEIEQRKRTTNRIIQRLQGNKRSLAARVAAREAVIHARDDAVRQLETEVISAQSQIADLLEQLAVTENVAQEHETSTKALTAKTLEQETVIEGLNADLNLEKQTCEHFADRARQSAGTVDQLQVSLAKQEDVNYKLGAELATQQCRACEAEEKIVILEVRSVELEASNEMWKGRAAREETKVNDLNAQNVILQAAIVHLEVRHGELEAANKTWKARAVEEQTKVNNLNAQNVILQATIVNLEACRGELEASNEARAARQETKVNDLNAQNAILQATIANREVRNGELEASNETWEARTVEEQTKVNDLHAQNVVLQAIIANFKTEVEGLKMDVAEHTAKADKWESKAHDHEVNATEWKACAIEEQARGNKLEASKRELEAEINDLNACVAEHECRAIALVAQIDEGSVVAREHERTAGEWKARATAHEATAADLEARNVKLEANIVNLRTEVFHLEIRGNEFAARAEHWESKAHDYETDAAGWKACTAEQRIKLEGLETHKHELEAEVSDLKTYVAEHELRAIALAAEIDAVKITARKHQDAAAEWEAHSTRHQGRADKLEASVSDLEVAALEVIQLKATVIDRDNTIDALETGGRELAVKVCDADARILVLEVGIQEWEDLAHQHDATADRWESRAAQLKTKADGLSDSVAELESRLVDLGDALTRAETKACTLDTQLCAESARASALEDRALELEDSAMNWEIRAMTGEDTANDWEVRAQAHAARATSLETRVGELESDILVRESRMSELEGIVSDRDARLRTAELISAEWKAQALGQEAKANNTEARVRELQVTTGELESRVNEQEEVKAAADQYTAQLEASLADSQQVTVIFIDRFRQGRDAVLDLTCRNTALSLDREELKARVATLEQEVEKAQAELAQACATVDQSESNDFVEDEDPDASMVKWNAMEEQLAAMEADTSTFMISDILLDIEAEDKTKANEDLTTWLDSEIDCLKYRLKAAQGELRASAAKFEQVNTELLRTTEELETQKRVNAELEKVQDALQAKQVATLARVQSLNAQKPAVTPLRARPNVTPNKNILAPHSKLATPRTFTKSVRSQSTRTFGERENTSPATLELQMDRDSLKAKLAASEKRIHDLKAQLANVSSKADALQVKLDEADSRRDNEWDKEGASATVSGRID